MDNAVGNLFIILLPIVAGWTLDVMFGDPEQLPHPVVAFGKWITFWEKRLNNGGCRKMKGAIFALTSILLVFIIATMVYYAIYMLAAFSLCLSHILFVTISTVLIFFCLAGHTLRKEVMLVFKATERSVEDGRRQVARIVGRDTDKLTIQECRTAALETLAENLSDGVVAPLFWLMLLGIPGMLAYKMVNTLDSMIGYRTPRYKDFGCWAAHIDDVANYVPARITAFLIILVSPVMHKADKFRFLFKYGNQHASPNSGWPEAALAGILNCRFGGTHDYFGKAFYKPYIGSNNRQLNMQDVYISIKICFIVECTMIISVFIEAVLLWIL